VGIRNYQSAESLEGISSSTRNHQAGLWSWSLILELARPNVCPRQAYHCSSYWSHPLASPCLFPFLGFMNGLQYSSRWIFGNQSNSFMSGFTIRSNPIESTHRSLARISVPHNVIPNPSNPAFPVSNYNSEPILKTLYEDHSQGAWVQKSLHRYFIM